jgi:hypothetical protein
MINLELTDDIRRSKLSTELVCMSRHQPKSNPEQCVLRQTSPAVVKGCLIYLDHWRSRASSNLFYQLSWYTYHVISQEVMSSGMI